MPLMRRSNRISKLRKQGVLDIKPLTSSFSLENPICSYFGSQRESSDAFCRMADPKQVFFFKTTLIDAKYRIREPVKLAHDAEGLLSQSRRRVLIMASGKSTFLDILTHGANIQPQPTLAGRFPAGEGYGGLTRSVHLSGPIPLQQFCQRWNIPPTQDDIDFFFVDTKGTDNEDSDRLAMTVLPVLGLCRRYPTLCLVQEIKCGRATPVSEWNEGGFTIIITPLASGCGDCSTMRAE